MHSVTGGPHLCCDHDGLHAQGRGHARMVGHRLGGSHASHSVRRLALLGLAGCTPDLTLATAQPYTPEWCQAAKAQTNRCENSFSRWLDATSATCRLRLRRGRHQLLLHGSRPPRPCGGRRGPCGPRSPLPDDDLRREAVARAEAERNRQAMITALRRHRRRATIRCSSPMAGPNMNPRRSGPCQHGQRTITTPRPTVTNVNIPRTGRRRPGGTASTTSAARNDDLRERALHDQRVPVTERPRRHPAPGPIVVSFRL